MTEEPSDEGAGLRVGVKRTVNEMRHRETECGKHCGLKRSQETRGGRERRAKTFEVKRGDRR